MLAGRFASPKENVGVVWLENRVWNGVARGRFRVADSMQEI